jgi:hypothetical protein
MKLFLPLLFILTLVSSPSFADNAEPPKPILYGMNGANYRTSEGAIRSFFEKILKVDYCLDIESSDKPCKSFNFKERTLKESLNLIEIIFSVKIEESKENNKVFYIIKEKNK